MEFASVKIKCTETGERGGEDHSACMSLFPTILQSIQCAYFGGD